MGLPNLPIARKGSYNVTVELQPLIFLGNVGTAAYNGIASTWNDALDGKTGWEMLNDTRISLESTKIDDLKKVDTWENICGAIATVYISKKLSFSCGTVSTENLFNARFNLARDFYLKSNVINIARHLSSINYNFPVFTKWLEQNTVLYRYTEIGTTQPRHYFFEEIQVAPGEVGKSSMYLDPNKFQLEKITLTKRVKVLSSTVDLGDSRGARQIFSSEIEKNSKIEPTTWEKEIKK